MRPTATRFTPLLALVWAGLAMAAPAPYVPGEVLVRYRADATAARHAALIEDLGVSRLESFPGLRVERLAVAGDVPAAVARLAARPEVAYAEPNYIWSIDARPDDSFYPQLYAMRNAGQTGGTPGADVRAELAWNLFTGSPATLVGVIDSGVDYTHPDLAANVWTNPGEVPGNGLDDDGNGYVDDVHGYDFVHGDGDPLDDNGHGTHVSGTIAAVGNNGRGVTGLCWSTRIVALKFLDSSGRGSTAAALGAMQYARRMGLRITNNSWGGPSYSQALSDAIVAAGQEGMLFVAAAGNSGLDSDLLPTYPAAYDLPSIISVAATNSDDQLASFSNWGATSVDLAAPGVDILSTFPPNAYRVLSGTSMASPLVAGACALLLGRFPDMGPMQARQRILDRADRLPGLAGRCVTGARLNAFLAISDPDTIAPGTIADLMVVASGSTSADLAWTATGDDGASGTATHYDLRWATAPIDAASFAAATPALIAAPASAGTAEQVRVYGLPPGTALWFAIRARDEFGNPGEVSAAAQTTTLAPPRAVIAPLALEADLRTGEHADGSFTILNDSPGTLEWRLPVPRVELAQPAPDVAFESLAKGQDGQPRGEQALSSGGPDAFGYRWLDSSDPQGPAFAWVDIEQPAHMIALAGDDEMSAPVPIGFSFPFYGARYTQLRVCTNGYLTFGDDPALYVNAGLPSARGARTMLAPFWDDLNFGAVGDHAFVQSDGARCVITWRAVPRYSDPASVHTFQVILHPTGEARFQYLTLTGVKNNCSIGIQDTTRTLGLTVSFNQDYARDSLAVRLVPLRQWLTASPDSGFLAPGQSAEVRVRMDASGLSTGVYEGAVHVLTNDPLAADVSVAATLRVQGAPDAAFGPAQLDFGHVFVGARDTIGVTVANLGVEPLRLLWVSSSPPFDVSFTPGTLAPGESVVLPVVFAPQAPGVFDQPLDIACDDPDLGLLRVRLTGSAGMPPVAVVEPATLRLVTANGLGTAVRDRTAPLRVRNDGAAPLHWRAIAAQVVGSAATPPGDAGVLRSGGPDGGGYRWTDSDSPGGPSFEWLEISGVGTRLFGSADDSTRTGIALPFEFPFYGGLYRSVNVCTNGWLSFGGAGTSFRNGALPDTSAASPRNLVAPWWDDLDLRSTTGNGRAYAHYDGTRFIVEWRDAVHYAVGGPYTFQAILWPNGTIEFQYLSIAQPSDQATIGIQDSTGTRGTTVVRNAPYAHAGLRVRLQRTPDWLTVVPQEGTIEPGEEDTLAVGMSAREQEDGVLHGAVLLFSDDVARPLIEVPARMAVGRTPVEMSVTPRSIGSLARASAVVIEGASPFAAGELDGASAMLGGVALDGAPVASAAGRVALSFPAIEWVAAGLADGPHALPFAVVAGDRTWLADTVLLASSRPALQVVGLPAWGSPQAQAHAMSGDPLSFAFVPPALVDHYEIALSRDGGRHWTMLASTPGAAWTFIPVLVGDGSLLEVSAWHGDSLTGVWMSAPFVVEPRPGTGVEAGPPPARFALRLLGQSGPGERARFALDLPRAGEVRLDLFDVQGARVRTLVTGTRPAGTHEIEWDGRHASGQSLAPGVYFARARWGALQEVRRVVVAR